MKALPYILQGSNIVVVVDNIPHTITESNLHYAKLKEAIKAGKWDIVPDLISPKKAIQQFVKGHFEFIDGVLYEEGVAVRSAISERLLTMYSEGFPVEPLLKFYKNIKENPSISSANELYGFLEKNSLPITEDGCFIAYKRVRADYLDCYTGTMDNSIGKVVEMDRSKVNGDRTQTCSTGLHFCSHSYLQHFGGDRIVTVKINPKDVVSIPTDYNDAKGRCCKYEVIGEVSDEAARQDCLSSVSVYIEIAHMDDELEEDYDEIGDDESLDEYFEDGNKLAMEKELRALGLRQQAKIYNVLTGASLKKFSYREDADRRLYGDFQFVDIWNAAKKLKLV